MTLKEAEFQRKKGAEEFADKLKRFLEREYNTDFLHPEIDKLLKL